MKSEFSQNFGQIIINLEGFISNYNPKKKKKKKVMLACLIFSSLTLIISKISQFHKTVIIATVFDIFQFLTTR